MSNLSIHSSCLKSIRILETPSFRRVWQSPFQGIWDIWKLFTIWMIGYFATRHTEKIPSTGWRFFIREMCIAMTFYDPITIVVSPFQMMIPQWCMSRISPRNGRVFHQQRCSDHHYAVLSLISYLPWVTCALRTSPTAMFLPPPCGFVDTLRAPQEGTGLPPVALTMFACRRRRLCRAPCG